MAISDPSNRSGSGSDHTRISFPLMRNWVAVAPMLFNHIHMSWGLWLKRRTLR